jgi:hypothetical protein
MRPSCRRRWHRSEDGPGPRARASRAPTAARRRCRSTWR